MAENGPSKKAHYQKNPRVRKMFVRNSGAGNGCVNFMDAWKKSVLSAGRTHFLHKIPRFRGGDIGLGGGGSADFIFMGARIKRPIKRSSVFLGPSILHKNLSNLFKMRHASAAPEKHRTHTL